METGTDDYVPSRSSSSATEPEWEQARSTPVSTPAREQVSLETRGRHPKDPDARATKIEATRLRTQLKKVEAERKKIREREQLALQLSREIGEPGVWQSAEASGRMAPPPAQNLPKLEEEMLRMKDADSADIADALARHAEVVDSEAYACRNLSGMSKRRLRMASLAFRAGIRILAERSRNPPTPALHAQRLDAMRVKARRAEEVARKRGEEIEELRKQLEELRNFKATMATGMSPQAFHRAISRSPKEQGVAPSTTSAPVAMEVEEGTDIPAPKTGSPKWLPRTRE